MDPDFLPPGEMPNRPVFQGHLCAHAMITTLILFITSVVCFALLPASIPDAGFASAVCKLQSRFTNMPCIRIR